MSDLTDLEQKIKAKLALRQEQDSLREQHFHRQMAEAEARHQRYTAIADRLMQEVIRPRMEKLSTFFENAKISEVRSSRHNSCCQFEHTARFPALASLEIGVSRDGEIKTLILQSRQEILPVFFTIESHDALPMLLERVDEGKATSWVDAKILHFVEAYLRVETSGLFQQENIVTDPVCRMSVNKAFAPAQVTHGGTTYYFCAHECHARFAQNPEHYLAR
jgi:YHS domain-containing protein